jgi:hypothetical protein
MTRWGIAALLAALATPCYAPQNIPRGTPPGTRGSPFDQAQQNIPSATRPDPSRAGQPGPCPATAVTNKQLAELRALVEKLLAEFKQDTAAFRASLPAGCPSAEWAYSVNVLRQLGALAPQ